MTDDDMTATEPGQGGPDSTTSDTNPDRTQTSGAGGISSEMGSGSSSGMTTGSSSDMGGAMDGDTSSDLAGGSSSTGMSRGASTSSCATPRSR